MNAAFAGVRKLCQTTGEWDRELKQPVFNRTDSRFGIFGTDLGSSFEHDGRLWFLFGDTWPSRARLTSGAALSRHPGRMELFFLTDAGILNSVSRVEDRWLDPVPLCGARFSQSARVAAVSRDPRHAEVFAIGEDGVIRGRWFWDEWRDWYVLGNARFSQTAGLAAVSRDPKHMEIFAVGEDGVIRGRWFWEDRWHDWYVLGDARFGQTTGLAAVSRSPKHMEVFAVGEDGVIRGRWFWEDRWHDWYVLGDARFSQTTGLAAVSRDPHHMEVFAVGEDGLVRGRWFWDNQWHPWFVLGERPFAQHAGLAAVSQAPGLMDVFAIGDDGKPWWTWFDGGTWKKWEFVESLTDSVAWTTANAAGPQLPLTFAATTGPCARYVSPRLARRDGSLANTSGFSVPISGFSFNRKMYVFYSEFGADVIMKRTYLALADGGDPTRLRTLYVASTADVDPDKDGHFINIACKVVDQAHPGVGPGLPFTGPALLMWGTGHYRHSSVYLAALPLAQMEDRESDRALWWFYTASFSNPWSRKEREAAPLIEGKYGELSVTWVDSLHVWLLLYHGETPILGSVAPLPWRPWSHPQTVIDTETVLGRFVHRANSNDVMSDPGRGSEGGALYGAYLIDRFTRPVDSTTAEFSFLLSTWNPYNTVLMTGTLKISD